MSALSAKNNTNQNGDAPDSRFPAAKRGMPAAWDDVILTASDEEQAVFYRSQIRFRLSKGLLSPETRFAVVPDLEGQRIGSGGAFFNVLKHLWELNGGPDSFENRRVLLINSGGDSVRAPQYSVCGKLFAPVPRELSGGSPAALFDEIMQSLAWLPAQLPPGILTVSGDILILSQSPVFNCEGCGAAALSVRDSVFKGVGHGVFVADEHDVVVRFLHKRSAEEQRQAGAVDGTGRVLIDTGAIWLGTAVVRDLAGLISAAGKLDADQFGVYVNGETRLSFYTDIVYPMARTSRLEEYYSEQPENGYTDELRYCRERLWGILRKYQMKMIELSPASFLHFGTTAQALDAMTGDIEKYSALGWRRQVLSNTAVRYGFNALCSFVDANSRVGEGTYLENSVVIGSKIGRRCVVSNIRLDGVEIPDNTAVHCLRQKDGNFVVRIYGVDDDPKRGLCDNGTFLNMPLTEYMKARGLAAEDLWPREPYDLWNARLYLSCPCAEASLSHALGLFGRPSGITAEGALLSMKQSADNADKSLSF